MVLSVYHRKNIIIITCLALCIRLAYVFFGLYSKGASFFVNDDSFSYTASIINFFEKGIYSFDLTVSDAAFGRLPGYPFFWGLHYLLFGSDAYLAVAISQSILDTVTAILLYAVVYRVIQNRKIALVTGIVYALYPFSIFWVAISGTECLATFITMFFLFIASRQKFYSFFWYISLGITCALAFYIREYLGILFPIAGIYMIFLLIRKRIRFLHLLVYGLSFVLLYSAWPIRNYVVYKRVEFLKPESSGYKRFGKDFSSMRDWMYTWNTDVQPYLKRILKGDNPEFPGNVFTDSAESKFIESLVDTCLDCGSSFYAWRNQELTGRNCDYYISREFDSLRKDFISKHPAIFYVNVPMQNLGKAIFKNRIDKPLFGKEAMAVYVILFVWRTLFVLLGIAGMFLIYRSFTSFIITCFSVFMYLFICFYVRQVEMRYLLQADVCLFIPAAFTIHSIINFFSHFGRNAR